MKRRIPYFITDDFRAMRYISEHYPHIQMNSSFFLISVADIHGLISDYNRVFASYCRIMAIETLSTYKKCEFWKRIRREYSKAAKLYGIPLSESKLFEKTGDKMG